MLNFRLKTQTKQFQDQKEMAQQIKKYQYNGQGLEKEPARDPLDFQNIGSKEARQKKASPTKKDEKVSGALGVPAMSQSQVHEKNMSMFNNLFKYWCKKKTSKFLRIQDFYRFMVIFGLAPNQQLVQQWVQDFDKQIKKPIVSPIDNYVAK